MTAGRAGRPTAPAEPAADPAPPQAAGRAREVFAQPGFRRLFATRIASQLGDGIFQLATADILVLRDPGDNPAARFALLTAVTLIPFSVLAPFAGVFIDRWDRRAILWRTPLARAALAVAVPMLAVEGPARIALYAIVVAVLSANRLFLATLSAVLPQLVPGRDLLVANSAASAGGSVATAAGVGVGGAIAALADGETAAFVAAGAFLVAGTLGRAIPARSGAPHPHAPVLAAVRAISRELVAGVRRVLSSRRARYALASVGTAQLLVGAVIGAIVHYLIAVRDFSVGRATAMLPLVAVGLFAGVVLVPLAARRVVHDRLIPAGFAIALVAVLASGMTLAMPSVAVAAVFVGVAYAFTKIPVETILQEEIEDRFRGRAFAAHDILFNVARVAGVAGVAAGVPLVETAEPLVLGIAGAYLAALAGFTAWGARVAPGGGPR